MLDTFRKHSNSSLIYLIFGALIFVFAVSFGPGSQGCKSGGITGSTEYAAKVNDDLISRHDFDSTYARVYADYQERAGGAFTPELADQLGLKKMVLEKLVERHLLYQAAQKTGLAVGDDELQKKIGSIKAFQKNGTFDEDQYHLWLERAQRTTAAQFEDELRKDMLSQKMLALVEQDAKVSDDEVKTEYLKQHDKVDLTFVRFTPAQFLTEVKVAPTDAELAKYATDHAKEISDFYNRNTYRYHKPQRLQSRHILIKAPEGAPEAEEKAAKEKADKVEAELKAGKDFSELAKQYSDDTATKDKGGELGISGPGAMDKKLEDAASKLTAGQFTEPVRTHFGYDILQVEKVLPAEEKKLEDVKKDIALELQKNDAAKQMAQQKAAETLKALQGGKKLAEQFPPEEKKEPTGTFDLASLNKVQAADTGPFAAEGDFVPKIGPAPELASAAFTLGPDKPFADKVFEVNNAYYVVELKSREKPEDKDFAEHKEELKQAVLQQKRMGRVNDYLKELKASAKVEENQALILPSGRTGAIPAGAS